MEPEPQPEPLPSGLPAHHDRQPQISAFADSFASDLDSGGIERLPQLTGRPLPQQSRIFGITSSPPPPAEVLEQRPEQPGAAGRRTPKPQRQHQPGMGEGDDEPSAGNNAMAAVFGWQW